jgi:hypothetical protein
MQEMWLPSSGKDNSNCNNMAIHISNKVENKCGNIHAFINLLKDNDLNYL